MSDPKPNTKHYAYSNFDSALTGWGKKLNDPEYTRALKKLKFLVLGYAWVDYTLWDMPTNAERKLVLSYAWEDTLVAFSGYGQSALTGCIIDLWNAVPKAQWPDFRAGLNAAKLQCENMTANTVPRRYLEKYRMLSVRTPQEGFDLPAVVPIWGPRLREWASLNGLDADETEASMRLIEQYEREGLIDLKMIQAEVCAEDRPAPSVRKVRHLTLVNTPKEEDGGAA